METATVLDGLSKIIANRSRALEVDSQEAEKSYTASLLKDGRAKILRKLGEEALEIVLAASSDSKDQQSQQQSRIVAESADFLYHLLVLWQDAGIEPDDVWAELAGRHGVSGLEEKASRQEKT